MAALSSRDYDRMLQLAAALVDLPQADEAWHLVGLEFVGPLLNADVFALRALDPMTLTAEVLAVEPEWAFRRVPTGSLLPDNLFEDHPLARHYISTPSYTPLKISDLVSHSAWRRTVAYASMRELIGTTHQLMLPLVMDDRTHRVVTVMRADRDFSERDKAVARSLQPLLMKVDRRFPLADRRRDAAPADFNITPAELRVLVELADGVSAAAIAERLEISPRTVGKHLERLYQKLGTGNRLATVLRAQQLGLIPPRPPAALDATFPGQDGAGIAPAGTRDASHRH